MRFTESEIAWAAKLRGKGLLWDPQPGHYMFDIDGVVRASSPFQAGVYLIESLNAFETLVGGPEQLTEKFAWLPSWEDARRWLKENDIGLKEIAKALAAATDGEGSDREVLYGMILDVLESRAQNAS